jgi:hypothetical protein
MRFLTPAAQTRLETEHAQLNPAKITRQIKQLINLAKQSDVRQDAYLRRCHKHRDLKR